MLQSKDMAEHLAAGKLFVKRDAAAASTGFEPAPLASRLLAYVIDSVLLFGFVMVFATFAALVVLVGSGSGGSSVTEGQEWGLMAVLMAVVPTWYIFNVLLCWRRAQTVGQYVVGLGVIDEEAAIPGLRRLAWYSLALHPLVFHPMFAVLWWLFAYAGLTLAGQDILFVVGLAMGLLSLVAPAAGLLFLLIDSSRRSVHERLSGLRVVRF